MTAEPSGTVAKRQATIAARKLATGYRPGDRVRVAAGTPRFADRPGTVVTTNLGEVGVSFGAADQTEAWFRPAELERVRSHTE